MSVSIAPEIASAATTVGYWQKGASLITPVVDATETVLANGLILVAGGENFTNGVPNALTTAELYNPSTGTWTSTGSLNTPRINAASVLLNNGYVLVAGGENIVSGVPTPLATAELYNPTTNLWTLTTGSMSSPNFNGTLTLLANGKALMAGGEDIASGVTYSETVTTLFNPATGTWTVTTNALPNGAAGATATALANGEVVLIGGESIVSGITTAIADVQIYDPSVGANGTWTVSAATLPTAEYAGSAALLSNGKVLFAGGETVASGVVTPLSTAYLFDPSTSTVTATGSLSASRYNAGATVLSNGTVLVAGGTGELNGQLTTLSSAEIYNPSGATWTTQGALIDAQSSPAIFSLAGGTVVALGGTSSTSTPTAAIESFLFGLAPVFTSSSSTTFTVGTYGTFTITTSGTPTPSLTEGGTLPTGLTFIDNGDGTASISGTSANSANATYTFTISATNATGINTVQSFTLTLSSVASPSTTSSQTTPTSTLSGYWLARANGIVYGHGSTAITQSGSRNNVVAIVSTPDGKGYWTVTKSGNIANIGDAGFFGSPVHVKGLAPIVAMSATTDGKGYWLLTSRGGVYHYGDAKGYGSVANKRRLLPAIGIATSPSGSGYWIASKNGIVTGFGGVSTYGSSPARRSIIGITASASGDGYWLTTSAGNVYNFGDAQFFGSLVKRKISSPIVANVANATGTGYLLVSASGTVYRFGAVASFGSSHVKTTSRIVGLALAYRT